MPANRPIRSGINELTPSSARRNQNPEPPRLITPCMAMVPARQRDHTLTLKMARVVPTGVDNDMQNKTTFTCVVGLMSLMGLALFIPAQRTSPVKLTAVVRSTTHAHQRLDTTDDPLRQDLTCQDALLGNDPLEERVRNELAVFTRWLSLHGQDGVVSEFGWWRDRDTTEWNRLADSWLDDLDAAGLWAIAWAVGPFDHTHLETPYSRSIAWPVGGADTPESQAEVLESHQSTDSYRRGIAVSGGSFGDDARGYSNEHPGTYGADWFYETQETFDFIADRGFDLVRIDFKWERIQPALNQALDTTELRRLQDAVLRAGDAGLEVVLDLHNYGAYYTGHHERHPIGGTVVSIASFADLWSRLSIAFQSNSNVVAYGLMNEPHDLAAARMTDARLWERASQAAVDAIREVGDRTLLFVPGSNWSHVQTWAALHRIPWIEDPIDNIKYEAHHYWTSDHAADYVRSYGDEATLSADPELGGASAGRGEGSGVSGPIQFRR